MTESQIGYAQRIFLAALDLPQDQREAWVARECAENKALFNNVMSLLGHAERTFDPLENNLDDVICDIPCVGGDQPEDAADATAAPMEIDCEGFLSRLSEVGVLSSAEFASVSDSIASGDSSAEPRQLASRLVTEGKLTDYQASALLTGEPKLLIDKYLILDLIDVGGMGMVFKAIHRTMNRVVAVK